MSGDHKQNSSQTGAKGVLSFESNSGSLNFLAIVAVAVLLICILFLVNIDFSGDASPQATDETTDRASNTAKDLVSKPGDETVIEMTDDPFGVGTSETEKKQEAEVPVRDVVKSDNEELKNIKLPVSLEMKKSVSLLDRTGEETEVPANTILILTNRSDGGTLTLEGKDEIYVGNETRIEGKFTVLDQ